MVNITEKKKINVVFLLVLLSCLTIQVYGFSDGLCMGKVVGLTGQVTIGSEDIKPDSFLYGNMFESINVGDDSSLEIILPPQFAFGNDYDGIIELESNTEIIPNIYTTDSKEKEWWKGENIDEVKDKTIIYIIDLNKGKANIRMSYNCMKYIDIFQFVCGDYDAVRNPRGGIIIDTSNSKDLDISIEVRESKLLVTVNTGKVKVFDRKDIDKTLSTGEIAEFDI
ncbi:MAG: hypothetical protein ACOC2J_04585 [bacterium]